jgi:hypothetical protein
VTLSAKSEELVVGAGVVSSPNKDLELAVELVWEASGGEVPNKDIVVIEDPYSGDRFRMLPRNEGCG